MGERERGEVYLRIGALAHETNHALFEPKPKENNTPNQTPATPSNKAEREKKGEEEEELRMSGTQNMQHAK